MNIFSDLDTWKGQKAVLDEFIQQLRTERNFVGRKKTGNRARRGDWRSFARLERQLAGLRDQLKILKDVYAALPASPPVPAETRGAHDATKEDVSRLSALTRRAAGGGDDACSDLRDLIKEFPAIWQQVGELSEKFEKSVIRAASGLSGTVAAIEDWLSTRKTKVARRATTPHERIDVERYSACAIYLHAAAECFRKTECRPENLLAWERILLSAILRYLEARESVSEEDMG
jgi:hypothetical protein